ncbi:MAG: FCD domain-containing protein [Alphaproteobacteria bacterium]|nr:FCD domain-containing protein [Alphaproteobacteria bacterium]
MNEASAPSATVTALRIRRTETLATLVRKELERMIVSGELKAGDRLNESALADRLGVSRGPIREACRGLEQSRLVEVVVNRGTFVRQISLQDALDIYDVRSALFGVAGETLAKRITPSQLSILSDLVARMNGAADDLDANYPLNVEYHAKLVEFSGNVRLMTTYRSLAQELHLFRRRGLVSEGSMAVSNREHRAILDALAKRDGARAGRLMREHILAGKNRLMKLAEAETGVAAEPSRRRRRLTAGA